MNCPRSPQAASLLSGSSTPFYDDGNVRRTWEKDDGIQVFGLTPEGQAILITERDYTHLVGGYVEPGEDPRFAAQREFLEETGYEPARMYLLSAVYQDSGGSDRAVWCFLAYDCKKVRESEAGITVELATPQEAFELIFGYVGGHPGKRKGGMSLICATLAMGRLGKLMFADLNS